MRLDLPTASSDTRDRTNFNYFWTGNLWWLLPPGAALLYPYAVRSLYESGKLLDRESGPVNALACLAVATSVMLVYGVPVASIYVAYRLGQLEGISSSELLARRLAHLAVAAPPLFVLIGVVFYLLHSGDGDTVFWWVLWLAALVTAAWGVFKQRTDTTIVSRPTSGMPTPTPLRVAHGCSALAILLIFLSWHLLNHLSAIYSLQLNEAMMDSLRKWYRSELIQPVLVILMLFQVVSGVTLLWRATASRSDLLGTLQTSTGAFLTAFIVSHLNSVFILGRAVTKVNTNFLWASGAPTGLLLDAWNVRLIPHYSLGVWFVITHLGIGLRGVLLAHRVSPAAANRLAWVVSGLGALVAVTITIAQLRVHGAGY
jgi:hypothetical protein